MFLWGATKLIPLYSRYNMQYEKIYILIMLSPWKVWYYDKIKNKKNPLYDKNMMFWYELKPLHLRECMHVNQN